MISGESATKYSLHQNESLPAYFSAFIQVPRRPDKLEQVRFTLKVQQPLNGFQYKIAPAVTSIQNGFVDWSVFVPLNNELLFGSLPDLIPMVLIEMNDRDSETEPFDLISNAQAKLDSHLRPITPDIRYKMSWRRMIRLANAQAHIFESLRRKS